MKTLPFILPEISNYLNTEVEDNHLIRINNDIITISLFKEPRPHFIDMFINLLFKDCYDYKLISFNKLNNGIELDFKYIEKNNNIPNILYTYTYDLNSNINGLIPSGYNNIESNMLTEITLYDSKETLLSFFNKITYYNMTYKFFEIDITNLDIYIDEYINDDFPILSMKNVYYTYSPIPPVNIKEITL